MYHGLDWHGVQEILSDLGLKWNKAPDWSNLLLCGIIFTDQKNISNSNSVNKNLDRRSVYQNFVLCNSSTWRARPTQIRIWVNDVLSWKASFTLLETTRKCALGCTVRGIHKLKAWGTANKSVNSLNSFPRSRFALDIAQSTVAYSWTAQAWRGVYWRIRRYGNGWDAVEASPAHCAHCQALDLFLLVRYENETARTDTCPLLHMERNQT